MAYSSSENGAFSRSNNRTCHSLRHLFPTALLVYSWFSRRNGGSQGRGLTSQHSLGSAGRSPNTHTDIAPQDSQDQQRGSVQSIPRYPIEGTSPQLGKALLRNYGLYTCGGFRFDRNVSDFCHPFQESHIFTPSLNVMS